MKLIESSGSISEGLRAQHQKTSRNLVNLNKINYHKQNKMKCVVLCAGWSAVEAEVAATSSGPALPKALLQVGSKVILDHWWDTVSFEVKRHLERVRERARERESERARERESERARQ